MAIVGGVMRHLPNGIYDALAARRPRKSRNLPL